MTIIPPNIVTNQSEKKNALSNASVKYYPGENILEVYTLKSGFLKAGPGGKRGRSKKSVEVQELYQQQAAIRAGTRIRELVLSNSLRYFWTLTYAEDVDDRVRVAKDFKQFIQRLNYHLGEPARYVAVMEVQEERALKYGVDVLHVHFACDRWMDVHQIADIWGNGFVFVSEHTGDILRVASYLAKYVKKGWSDERIRVREKKRYFCSKGLTRPERRSLYLTDAEVARIAKQAAVEVEFEGARWMQVKDAAGKVENYIIGEGERSWRVFAVERA